MKTKLFTILILLWSALSLSAQGDQKVLFGLQAGVNFQNLNGKDILGNELENSLATGFHAGLNAIIPIAPEFYFQPVLQFSQKGAKNTIVVVDVNYKISYIEMPLNLLYRGALGDGYVLLGFGPYVGYAVKAIAVAGDVETDMDIKAFDAGAGVYAGYETALGLYFQLNTQYGLLNINPDDNNSVRKNVGFGLSLSYRFF